MADQDHLEVLKKGVETWNRWRKERTEVAADLSYADLGLWNLTGADFASVNFQGANLNAAILTRANMENADLSKANLRLAHLRDASLFGAILTKADLQEADLSWANLSAARLEQTNLSRASLPGANLCNVWFEETDLSYCQIGWTQFDSVDFSAVKGLETVQHGGPSIVSIDTIYLSNGNIPEDFLRGAGVPEPFIVQMKLLVAAMSPVEFTRALSATATKIRHLLKSCTTACKVEASVAGWTNISFCPAMTSTMKWIGAFGYGTRCCCVARSIPLPVGGWTTKLEI